VQSASRLTAAVVSSYALYFIGVARAPKSVVGLAAFQNGRLHASHAAPFDAEFRLQANVAVGGGFFSDNMNTPEAPAAAAPRAALPYGADPWAAGVDGVQFLRNWGEWLPSWVAEPAEIVNAEVFDEAHYEVKTPRLGAHTRFVIHSATHLPK